MNSSQNGGKSKSSRSSRSSSSKSSSSKSKKGGNFLGSVSELFVPTGWESFATAAGLLAIDRADAAFRRGRNSSKKQKGGADLDGHESIEAMDNMLDKIQSEDDLSSPNQMNGGGAKKTTKSKTTKSKTTKSKTTKSKTGANKTTKSKTAAKKKTTK
jgi:hypothetical protein